VRFELVPADGPILDEILTATFDVWHEGLSRRAYDRYYTAQLATPWGRSALRRWALVDAGAVLASAKVYQFSGVLDGQSIRIAGLGAVFTQPAHRGRGYARMLVDRILERGRMVMLDGPSMRTKHLGLDDPTSSEALHQPARISGIEGAEFPEPTASHHRHGAA